MLMWKDVISIAAYMHECKSEAIAEKLGVDAATISRIKSGKTTNMRLTSEEVYDKLFDPSIFQFSMDERDLFLMLQDELAKNFFYIIEDLVVDENNYKLKSGYYKEFVLEVLERIGKKNLDNVFLSKIRNALGKLMQQYDVPEFIEDDPIDCVQSPRFFMALDFMDDLRPVIIKPFFRYKEMNIYKQICKLEQLMEDYVNYLAISLRPLHMKTEDFLALKMKLREVDNPTRRLVPLYREENDDALNWAVEFENETRRFRRKLCDLINEIMDDHKFIDFTPRD